MHKSQKIGLKRLKRRRKAEAKKAHFRQIKEFFLASPEKKAQIIHERRHAKDAKKKERELIRKQLDYKEETDVSITTNKE